MTSRTIVVEVVGLMVGIGRTCESFRMAAIAITRCAGVARTMASLTLQ